MNEEFLTFLSTNPQKLLIEAEGHEDNLRRFISHYNSTYNRSINVHTNGICILNSDDSKWGVELRIYFNKISGLPEFWEKKKYKNSLYHSDEFHYRLDNTDLANYLFSHGYHIGLNL